MPSSFYSVDKAEVERLLDAAEARASSPQLVDHGDEEPEVPPAGPRNGHRQRNREDQAKLQQCRLQPRVPVEAGEDPGLAVLDRGLVETPEVAAHRIALAALASGQAQAAGIEG